MFCNMRQEASSMAAAARDTAVMVATQHMEQWMTKYITWVQFVLLATIVHGLKSH